MTRETPEDYFAGEMSTPALWAKAKPETKPKEVLEDRTSESELGAYLRKINGTKVTSEKDGYVPPLGELIKKIELLNNEILGAGKRITNSDMVVFLQSGLQLIIDGKTHHFPLYTKQRILKGVEYDQVYLDTSGFKNI